MQRTASGLYSPDRRIRDVSMTQGRAFSGPGNGRPKQESTLF